VVVSGAFGPRDVGGPARKIAICLVVTSWLQLEWTPVVRQADEPRGAAENTAKKQRGRPFRPDRSGNPQGRPRRRDRAQITVPKFANRKNSYCGTMACLDHAKLANSLIGKASHFSLGSANYLNDFEELGGGDPPVTKDKLKIGSSPP
jgi:hypothetical protein